jgi:hypothetical protein
MIPLAPFKSSDIFFFPILLKELTLSQYQIAFKPFTNVFTYCISSLPQVEVGNVVFGELTYPVVVI